MFLHRGFVFPPVPLKGRLRSLKLYRSNTCFKEKINWKKLCLDKKIFLSGLKNSKLLYHISNPLGDRGFTLLTNSFHHYFYMPGLITFGKFYLRCYHIIQAISIFTNSANKMYVMILVTPFRTFIFAQCIPDWIICSGNSVNDTLINKSLKCAVNSNPVKFFSGFLFNISMCQCPGLFQEKLQNFFAASCYTQAVTF